MNSTPATNTIKIGTGSTADTIETYLYDDGTIEVIGSGYVLAGYGDTFTDGFSVPVPCPACGADLSDVDVSSEDFTPGHDRSYPMDDVSTLGVWGSCGCGAEVSVEVNF